MNETLLIAIISGVFGLLTLAIQTYGQVQLAKIKDSQAKQASASVDNGAKLEENAKKMDDQTSKIAEVHQLVNSDHARLIAKVEVLAAEVVRLRNELESKDK